jgi:hypothetical protein
VVAESRSTLEIARRRSSRGPVAGRPRGRAGGCWSRLEPGIG